MDEIALRGLLVQSDAAVLATVGVDGKPHAVPICFALDGQVIYFAVDHKPKRTTDLKRLHNIAANPSVSVLAQHYEHDWNRLWWVRVDGTAKLLPAGDASARAVELLVDRYAQYRARPPEGPVVAITIERLTGWSATG
jgi:PPOX class probable F420-dependent enzyme